MSKDKIVLIVDDEAEMREILDEIVGAAGYRVLVRESAESALPFIKKADALITDFHMSGMDGAELIESAKLQNPNIKALLITGTLRDVPRDHLASKVIEKPFRVGDVLSWLRIVLPG